MKLSECLEISVRLLQKEKIPYAVAGGLAAGLYRSEPRMTGDVDFILALGSDEVKKAQALLGQLGFSAGAVRKAEFDGGPLFAIKKKNTPVVMVVGREKGNPLGVGADLMLSVLPWVKTALIRAGNHQVDFGFGPVPVLTVEDVILSKLYAMKGTVDRGKDLDDLQSIMMSDPELDLPYLKAQILNCELKLSKQKIRSLPEGLAGIF